MPKPQKYGLRLYSFALPRLPSDLPLPPLPPITDEQIRKVATTHTSVYQVNRDTFDLDTENYSEILDYEKLEFLGDKIIGVCADLVVQELHPNMRQGMATRVHDHLVSNETLAQLADRYGVTDMLQTSVDAGYLTKMQVKTKGSVFESYVAGVFYSFMITGPSPVEVVKDKVKMDKPSFGSPTASDAPSPPAQQDPPNTKSAKDPEAVKAESAHGIATKRSGLDLKAEDDNDSDTDTASESDQNDTDSGSDSESECRSNMLEILYAEPDKVEEPTTKSPSPPPNTSAKSERQKSPPMEKKAITYGQALDHVYAWLRPLYIPLAQYAIHSMRQELDRLQKEGATSIDQVVEDQTKEEQVAGGALNALNVYCENTFGRLPEFTIVRARAGIWRATCEVTDFEGVKHVGVGEKGTKKVAKMLASYQVAVQLKLCK